MQFAFAGSPTFAADILQLILDAGLRPQLVITQTSKPTGRGQKLRHTPVYSLALRENIPIATPYNIEECVKSLKDLELLAVAAYGQILPRSVLNAPLFGCINVHTSLLPRWRGASPIEHAILHGDKTTGVSIMQIESKLDAGPIYLQQSCSLDGKETTTSLSNVLTKMGGNALLTVLNDFCKADKPIPRPQAKTGVTYAPRLSSNDARINWGQTATVNERKVRAFVGRNAAFTSREELRLRVLEAEVREGEFLPGRLYRSKKTLTIGCTHDGLQLRTVQLNRGKGTPLSVASVLNGFGRLFEDGVQFD
ncbi:MAG: methionyl-tRNA formyltransferase [Gammaproteobacteria bacterium]|nr:methionyl-tRNA formyltransferase [Gammaproteobacteria bacterium]MYI77508.1 methionyl-tRNA formyltransferase [Gammaproteobacteria bacterium]